MGGEEKNLGFNAKQKDASLIGKEASLLINCKSVCITLESEVSAFGIILPVPEGQCSYA